MTHQVQCYITRTIFEMPKHSFHILATRLRRGQTLAKNTYEISLM